MVGGTRHYLNRAVAFDGSVLGLLRPFATLAGPTSSRPV